MAVVDCVSITKLPDGRVQVQWDSGEGFLYGSIQAIKDEVALLDTRDTAQRIAMAWWLARTADGSNENLIEGKRITVDFSAANPIRVQ